MKTDHTLLIETNLPLTNISGSSQQQGETLRQKRHGHPLEATKEVCQAKDSDNYGQGDTFSVKINRIIYHLNKMDKSVITASYRNWYQSAIESITDSLIWDWYRIAKQLKLDGIRHPYDILADKLFMHLPELEMFTTGNNFSIL